MWKGNRHAGMQSASKGKDSLRGYKGNGQAVVRSASDTRDMLRGYIREIEDFPKRGILFRDITPLLQNGKAFGEAISRMANGLQVSQIDIIACVESRGFIIGAALAGKLGSGVIPIRKKGKLPYKVCSETYDLEYGTDTLEMHADAISPGQRVLIVDDVLATGGTARAVVNIINNMQGTIVGAAFLLELMELEGRKKLEGYPVSSLLQY